MNSGWNTFVGMLAISLCGCQSVHQLASIEPRESQVKFQSTPLLTPNDSVLDRTSSSPRKRSSEIVKVSFETDLSGEDQESTDIAAELSIAPMAQSDVTTSKTLKQVEEAAFQNNPAIAKALAELESLQGKKIQAGLAPNPTVGVNGEDINEGGGAGRYGVYFGREIVRGNKLGLSQQVVDAEIQAAQQRLAVVEIRLKTDVQSRFYDLLVAQETVRNSASLVEISKNAVEVSKKLYDAKETALTAVLQSELELQNSKVSLKQAENQRLAAKRRLDILLGGSVGQFKELKGDPAELLKIHSFEDSLDQLTASSPELSALLADVESRRRKLERECVEAVPNITWQASVQYDTVADDVITGFQLGMPLPTSNWNQGAIRQARQQVLAAKYRADKKTLQLRQQLATAYESYIDAKLQVDAYQIEIIPKAKQALELATLGYRQGEASFLQLLTSQRTYSMLNLTYLQKLKEAWQQNVRIRGLLLSGSLSD